MKLHLMVPALTSPSSFLRVSSFVRSLNVDALLSHFLFSVCMLLTGNFTPMTLHAFQLISSFPHQTYYPTAHKTATRLKKKGNLYLLPPFLYILSGKDQPLVYLVT